MTPCFEIIDARAYHCGQMARILRHDHLAAMERMGADPHRELRTCFDNSAFRKAWLIDGKLAALGGVGGALVSGHGMVWLAFSEQATRYPVAIIKEARRQLDGLMGVKRELVTWLHEADPASLRLALFLQFRATDGPWKGPAQTRGGRRLLAREIIGNVEARAPRGRGFLIPMAYEGEAA
jgi:hypothetical protein